jgi:transposase
MASTLTAEERAGLQQALRQARRSREWRRFRAILLWGEGASVAAIAVTLQVSRTSVYNWLVDWRQEGVAGLHEGVHPGPVRRLDPAGLSWLDALLQQDPQTYGYALTGWTIPALHTEVTKAGYTLSDHTLRRAVWRLGWRWKRPKFVLGRPDPAYAEKKSAC